MASLLYLGDDILLNSSTTSGSFSVSVVSLVLGGGGGVI